MSFDDFSFDDFPAAAPTPPPGPVAPPAPPPRAPLLAPQAPRRPAAPPWTSRAKAGLGIITVAAGACAGGFLGGPLGALAGLVGTGAARNLYRSQGVASSDPSEQADAARSLAIGVIGLGIVGYLGYKIFVEKDGD